MSEKANDMANGADEPVRDTCSQDRDRCPMCRGDRGFVEVHGHVQCLSCGNNVDPCCGGAQLQ